MRIVYRYRLNENHKDSDTSSIQGYTVSRNWTNLMSRYAVLENYIRTKSNPEGILDYEEYDCDNQAIYFSSNDNITQKPITSFTREELTTLGRKELERVAHSFDLNPIRKRNAFLIDLICKAQDHIKLNNAVKVKEELVEKIDEPVVEPEQFDDVAGEGLYNFDFNLNF